MDLKIFVMTHKYYPEIKKYLDDSYEFMQVGAINNQKIDGYVSDHFLNSISSKNLCYSELTGLYALYKNENYDYMGLIHYRRFFSGKPFSIFSYKALSRKQVEKHLKNFDIILPKLTKFRQNLYENYKTNHYINDLDETRKVIVEKYPAYVDEFDKHVNGHKAYISNMFITSKKIIDEYSKWLFDILFELEKRVDISSYDNYQKRIFGFISERLFNVWLEKQNLKVKEIEIVTTELNPTKEFIKNIGRKIFGVSGISNTKKGK